MRSRSSPAAARARSRRARATGQAVYRPPVRRRSAPTAAARDSVSSWTARRRQPHLRAVPDPGRRQRLRDRRGRARAAARHDGGCISSDGLSGATPARCVDGAGHAGRRALARRSTRQAGPSTSAASAGSPSTAATPGDGELTQTASASRSAPSTGCVDVIGVGVGDRPRGDARRLRADQLASLRHQRARVLPPRERRHSSRSDRAPRLHERRRQLRRVPERAGAGRVSAAPSSSPATRATSTRPGRTTAWSARYAARLRAGRAPPRPSASATTRRWRSASTCSDLNGDALTYSVTRTPASGLLGAIDQRAANVVYSPNSGFPGGDSFDYRATAPRRRPRTPRGST